MSENYRTTLYVASTSEVIPPKKEIREELWKQIQYFGELNNFTLNNEKQRVLYKQIEISFLVNDSVSERLCILSFQPTGDNKNYWGKSKTKEAASYVLEFCDSLGPEINLSACNLNFKRKQLSKNDYIDISYWEVVTNSQPPTKDSLFNYLRDTASCRYENIFSSIPQDTYFHIFTQSFFKGSGPFPTLRNILSQYGQVKGPKSIVSAKEFSESLNPSVKKKSVFVFLEDAKSLETWYANLKIFFDSNHVPTQYIDEKTVTNKLNQWVGVKANLIFEMLTKMGKPPMVLQPPEELFINDAFLCLSDVVSTHQRLFGAIFTYSNQGLNLKGNVQIYDDIEFKTPTNHSLEISEENVSMLAEKIQTLIGRRLKIDILLTKKWSEENIEKLVDLLASSGIDTQKVYYISSKTSRFVDDFLDEYANKKCLRYPYAILGNKIAFLKTCNEIRIYPTIFSLYVELMWPKNAKISQGDLEKILWLVKKRIYRIQEFHVLKNVEPVYIFRNLRKMYLGKIEERLKIPIRLLI